MKWGSGAVRVAGAGRARVEVSSHDLRSRALRWHREQGGERVFESQALGVWIGCPRSN